LLKIACKLRTVRFEPQPENHESNTLTILDNRHLHGTPAVTIRQLQRTLRTTKPF